VCAMRRPIPIRVQVTVMGKSPCNHVPLNKLLKGAKVASHVTDQSTVKIRRLSAAKVKPCEPEWRNRPSLGRRTSKRPIETSYES
jgi:hypothetical protein